MAEIFGAGNTAFDLSTTIAAAAPEIQRQTSIGNVVRVVHDEAPSQASSAGASEGQGQKTKAQLRSHSQAKIVLSAHAASMVAESKVQGEEGQCLLTM